MHNFKLFLISFFLSNCLNVSSQNHLSNLESKLKKLPGVYVKKIETLSGFSESYELAIVQPVNHKNPKGKKFTQKVFLSHKDFDKPILFETHGYDVPWHKPRELSKITDANQIIVEHRFYGGSKPSAMDWNYLSIWQSASDYHRIYNLLKSMYSGKWISTGKSKGGMSALFYNYFYPSDIDITVVFVAPIINELEDTRMIEFINTKGSLQSRRAIQNFQINCLKNRTKLKRILSEFLRTNKVRYSLSLDEILEWSVLEFPYSFWFKNTNYTSIPNARATPQQFFNYLNNISPVSLYGDDWIEYNHPLIWQQLTELGGYKYQIDHLKPLLQNVQTPSIKTFAPVAVKIPEFNSKLMLDIRDYLENQAKNTVYIYGENDIYTAAKITPSGLTNSIQIIAEGLGHRFKISNLKLDKQELIINKINEWMHSK